jgi:predicted GIY-YIG superfamily endonuclease
MKTKCRVKKCRGNTKKLNHFYICRVCKAAFFHGTYKYGHNGLKDFNNDEIWREELLKSNIRPAKYWQYYVYVIQASWLTGDEKKTVYVGMTGKHPHSRLLDHMTNRKKLAAKIFKRKKNRRQVITMLGFEGPMIRKKALTREKSLAYKLKDKYLVEGGH